MNFEKDESGRVLLEPWTCIDPAQIEEREKKEAVTQAELDALFKQLDEDR